MSTRRPRSGSDPSAAAARQSYRPRAAAAAARFDGRPARSPRRGQPPRPTSLSARPAARPPHLGDDEWPPRRGTPAWDRRPRVLRPTGRTARSSGRPTVEDDPVHGAEQADAARRARAGSAPGAAPPSGRRPRGRPPSPASSWRTAASPGGHTHMLQSERSATVCGAGAGTAPGARDHHRSAVATGGGSGARPLRVAPWHHDRRYGPARRPRGPRPHPRLDRPGVPAAHACRRARRRSTTAATRRPTASTSATCSG